MYVKQIFLERSLAMLRKFSTLLIIAILVISLVSCGYKCDTCLDNGVANCPTCNGASVYACPFCSGAGSVERSGEAVDCDYCNGGTVDCPLCNGGKMDCPDCDQ